VSAAPTAQSGPSVRLPARQLVGERRSLINRPEARVLLGAVGVAIVLGSWQLLVVSGALNELDVPKCSTVLAELWRQLSTEAFWSAVGRTAAAAGIGLLIAMAIGITLGVLMGANEIVRHALLPTVEFLRPVPGLALLPLALVIWGPVRTTDVFLVAFGCTWPILIQTLNGVHAVDDVALLTARSLGLTWRERIRWLFLPGALAYIATGLRICVAVALIVAIGAEIIGGSPGIGNEIRKAQTGLDLPKMYALVMASGFLGLGATLLTSRIERRALRWHPSQRRGA
jgi:ABC-type nitrate/sulfonate/bicarbonate transport system permease component